MRLGEPVCIHRFMVSVCGRTGWLNPALESMPLAGELYCWPA